MIICCSWCFSPIRCEEIVNISLVFCCDECAAAFFAAAEDEDAGEDEQ